MIDIRALLQERNPRLFRRLPSVVFPLLRAVAHERLINAFVTAHRRRNPREFCEYILARLDISVRTENEHYLRDAQRPIICANHPTGGVEGLALIATILRVRGVCRVPANDLLRLVVPLDPVIVPVNRSRPTSRSLYRLATVFKGDEPLLVFPAGVTARVYGKILREYPWESSFVTRARRTGRTVLPVHVDGRNSTRFYLIHTIRRVLGIGFNLEMALLVDELIRRRGSVVTLHFLPPRTIPRGRREDDRNTATALQREVEEASGMRTFASPAQNRKEQIA